MKLAELEAKLAALREEFGDVELYVRMPDRYGCCCGNCYTEGWDASVDGAYMESAAGGATVVRIDTE